MPSAETPLDKIEELGGKVIHFRCDVLEPMHKLVVSDHRGYCRKEPRRGCNESLSDAWRHGLNGRRLLKTETHERADYPHDCAQQSHEGSHGGGCRQPAHAPFQYRQLG